MGPQRENPDDKLISLGMKSSGLEVAWQRRSDGSVYGGTAREMRHIRAVLIGEGKDPEEFFMRIGD